MSVSRIQVVETLVKDVIQNQWCVVLAPPLSGKTILGKQLFEQLSARLPARQIEFVTLRPASTLRDLWTQIFSQLGIPCPELMASGNQEFGKCDAAELLATSIETRSRATCLIIDDIEAVSEQILQGFAQDIRRLHNDIDLEVGASHLCFVLLGGDKLYYLQAGPYSPLSTIVKRVYLPDFSLIEIKQYLESRSIGNITEDVIEEIMTATEGHPHLVATLVKAFETGNDLITKDTVNKISDRWIEQSVADPSSDSGFFRVISHLERHRKAFLCVIKLLDGMIPDFDTRSVGAMSGAIRIENPIGTSETLHFRGKMLKDALCRYFDPIRRADFTVIHGSWRDACEAYRSLPASIIRARRHEGASSQSRRIMDLVLSGLPHGIKLRTVKEAAEFIANSGRFLLGADAARVWQRTRSTDKHPVWNLEIPYCFPVEQLPASDRTRDFVHSSIRYETSLKFADNTGIVLGLGDPATTCQWAVELLFADGLPTDEWFDDRLRDIRTTYLMILDRAKSREEERSRLKGQRELIHNIAKKLLDIDDVNEVLRSILEGISEHLEYECAQICLVFNDEGVIRSVRADNAFRSIQDTTIRKLSEGDPLADAIKTKRRRIVGNVLDPKEGCDQVAAKTSGIKSFVVVPMLDGVNAIGVLQVGNSTQFDAFTEADADLLQLLADHAAVALRMASWKQRVLHALNETGTAFAFIDGQGKIEYSNRLYETFLKTKAGDSTIVRQEGEGSLPLVRIAFQEEHSVATIRSFEGHKHQLTAIGSKDVFGRFSGGVEVIETKNRVLGLNDSLIAMLNVTDRKDLEAAIVSCLVKCLGYSRARLFRMSQSDQMISSCSSGMSKRSGDWFNDGNAVLRSKGQSGIWDGFECVRNQSPVIVVNGKFMPSPVDKYYQPIVDKRGRTVIVADLDNEPFVDDLEKNELLEWVDVPLGFGLQCLGKLSVDLKDQERTLGQEDIEILSLFAQWAADALRRVIELEKSREQVEFVRDARLAGERRGLEALAWDFLLNITSHGGLEFNRAALFLRSPHSGTIKGFACHGAADYPTWKQVTGNLRRQDDRRKFIAEARRAKLNEPAPPEEQERIERFRRFEVIETEASSALACACHKRVHLTAHANAIELEQISKTLGWENSREGWLVPLHYESECEGIIYVDRPYSSTKVTPANLDDLEDLCANLALIARPLRMSEMLRSQVLSVSHGSISPVAAIKALAEALEPQLSDAEQLEMLQLMKAEAQRSADVFRRLLRSTTSTAIGFTPQWQEVDVLDLVQRRVQPYRILLEADGGRVAIPTTPQKLITADPSLLGDVFAELASNAMYAIQAAGGISRPQSTDADIAADRKLVKFLEISLDINYESHSCEISIVNSGNVIPSESRARIWDRFVSERGGTGIGLWLVKEIVASHRGSVVYSVTDAGYSKFTIKLPCQLEDD